MLAEETDSVSVVSIPSPSSLATECTSRTGRSVFRRSLKFFVAGFETAGPERYLLMSVIRMKLVGLFHRCDCLRLESSILNSLQKAGGGKVKKREKARHTHNVNNRKYSLSLQMIITIKASF